MASSHHADEGTVLVVSHGTVLHQMLPRLLENLDGQWDPLAQSSSTAS